jgi:hypothetical protein
MRRPVFAFMVTLAIFGIRALSFANETLVVPETSVRQVSHLPLNLSGQGSSHVGAIQLANGSGSVELENRLYSLYVYYQSPPWLATGEVDYQGIASDGSSWDVFFIRCGAGKLDWIFYEDLNGTGMKGEAPSSADLNLCEVGAQGPLQTVDFPPISMQAPPPTSEWNLSGPRLEYKAGVGGEYQSADGTRYELYPFTTVDCTQCETPGWYELHSLFYAATTPQLCFGIIYLHPDTGKINIGYSLCLPDLTSPLNGDVSGSFAKQLNNMSDLQ